MDTMVINQIKALALDMVDEAKSGHPGIILSAAPILYTLYTNHLKFNPLDSTWINRDRFVMSAGHGSALLYATLYALGYDLNLDDLKHFRQVDSKTPGHPEYGLTPGVDMTTGPLGQGFAAAVGMALAERYLNKLIINQGGSKLIIDHYTYVLCGDGDLMEGISYESASFAGQQKLGKLIVLYDSNDICLDGETKDTFTEDVLKRFEAMNWHTVKVDNGNNINTIDDAIIEAKKVVDKPSLIEIKTIIGYESVNEGRNIVHGKPLEEEDLINLKKKWKINLNPFMIDENLFDNYRNNFKTRIHSEYLLWSNLMMKETENNNILKIIRILNYQETEELNWNNLDYPSKADELRNYNNQILNFIANNTQTFLGGSADLSSSCKTNLKNYDKLDSATPDGKNIYFGVREHAMGAILNGMALSGLTVYGSTFLTFADYQKAALRMCAIMKQKVVYIYTHDSIAIGEDGSTHQPIEQLGTLRSIPNVEVYRPGDFNELIGSWQNILASSKPSCLIINKNKVALDIPGKKEEVANGAYIISSESKRLDGIIIATGSEVEVALNIQQHLLSFGHDIRIVSLPCLEKFEQKDQIYQQTILPVGTKTFVIEASNDEHLRKFVYNNKHLLNLNTFGVSGKKDDVLKKYNFNFEALCDRIDELLK